MTPLPRIPLQMDLSFLIVLAVVVFIGLFFMERNKTKRGKRRR